MGVLNNINLSLKSDVLSNWVNANPVPKNGELIIVKDADGTESLKIGNGVSAFNDLKYVYQSAFKTDKVQTKDIEAKSIAQGYSVAATPTSLATGLYSRAEGNFDVVHGVEAKAKAGDDFAFVFNGEDKPGLGVEFYESHGKGTFNVNTLSGLSGVYIGDKSLAGILGDYFRLSSISDYYTKNQVNALYNDLDSGKASRAELSDEISSVRKDLSDYTDVIGSAVVSKIPVNISQLSNDAGYISAHQSLSDYYTKGGVNSLSGKFREGLAAVSALTAYETISDLTSNYYQKSQTSSAEQISGGISLKSSISVDGIFSDKLYTVNISLSDYARLLEEGGILSNALYIVSSDFIDAESKRIIYVAEPELSDDAATKNYVDSSISDFLTLSDIRMSYDSAARKIYLSADGVLAGTVDCADFVKDGMLANAVLNGNTLVMTFNTDAGKSAVSVDLSKFVDDYDSQIAFLSGSISADVRNLADNYYTKSQVNALSTAFRSGLTLETSLTAYETKDQLSADYYAKSETSSSSQIDSRIAELSNEASSYTETLVAAAVASIPLSVSQLQNDAGYLVQSSLDDYYTRDQVSSASEVNSALAGKQASGDYAARSTTLTGYGITDAKITGTAITLGSTTITALTAHQSLTAYETKADLTSNYYTRDVLSTGQQVKTAFEFLSNAVSSKINVDGTDTDLSVMNIDISSYAALLEESSVVSNCVYVVSSEYMDADGEKIRNVAEPELSSDAATKNYVDNALCGQVFDFSSQTDIYRALSAVITRFGGQVVNFPG